MESADSVMLHCFAGAERGRSFRRSREGPECFAEGIRTMAKLHLTRPCVDMRALVASLPAPDASSKRLFRHGCA
jgi:hypothetical protein